MKKNTNTCYLKEPAQCQFKVDGKFSFVMLCGGTSLTEEVSKCPYRYKATFEDDYVEVKG